MHENWTQHPRKDLPPTPLVASSGMFPANSESGHESVESQNDEQAMVDGRVGYAAPYAMAERHGQAPGQQNGFGGSGEHAGYIPPTEPFAAAMAAGYGRYTPSNSGSTEGQEAFRRYHQQFFNQQEQQQQQTELGHRQGQDPYTLPVFVYYDPNTGEMYYEQQDYPEDSETTSEYDRAYNQQQWEQGVGIPSTSTTSLFSSSLASRPRTPENQDSAAVAAGSGSGAVRISRGVSAPQVIARPSHGNVDSEADHDNSKSESQPERPTITSLSASASKRNPHGAEI
ncbi:hypothetical protein BC939DRAFT_449154 [Gamsiella multidivaricata]|uniref:uncharacterized protein n=1 Tax=Gamsiella multidivaricata TaxID=101098 RepID=UPI00221E9649|nr:uncharacterized protein BC939DRAFT_449154 [Gamsiella multidivaricata]KAG0364037.1 hypothetical protein BGZ54_007897 [Gamsiella multidivaricata]KAI7824750.1 hypothetical protein BC939DRAFT_449154 [Gamsiella multidivaricata]